MKIGSIPKCRMNYLTLTNTTMTLKEKCSQCGKAVEYADTTMESGNTVCMDCYNSKDARLIFYGNDISSTDAEEPRPFYTECPKDCEHAERCRKILSRYPSYSAGDLLNDIEAGFLVPECRHFSRLVELFYRFNTGDVIESEDMEMLNSKVESARKKTVAECGFCEQHITDEPIVQNGTYFHKECAERVSALKAEMHKDGIEITTFASGAFRCATGRRYDLMSESVTNMVMCNSAMSKLVSLLLRMDKLGSVGMLYITLQDALDKHNSEILDLYAKALDEGACKYGERNWEKGIPESDLVNHAIAHAIKLDACDTSEDHASHLVWNVLTIIHFRLQEKNNEIT